MAVPSQYAGLAATWNLQADQLQSDQVVMLNTGSTESVFQPDCRTLVEEYDYKDGGKYRSIVKLEMSYEGGPASRSMGTGWLITPDLLVTAGHCVYDHKNQERGATAEKIVTTGEWVDSSNNRHKDVAFIQLDRPFTGNLRLFGYKSTPIKGYEMIGVVGYPGDRTLSDRDGIEEQGAQMYELFGAIMYNRNENVLQMLQYKLSTFGGQSGAPVIRKKTPNVSIAAHCYGGEEKNSASPIGANSNDYDAYLKVFSSSYPTVVTVRDISFVQLPVPIQPIMPTQPIIPSQPTMPIQPIFATQPLIPVEPIAQSQPMVQSQPIIQTQAVLNPPVVPIYQDSIVEESFVEIVKAVSDVTKREMLDRSPFFGPLGGPLSALAGAALEVIAKFGGPESMMNLQKATSGSTERAILAEATLQSVLQITDHELSERLMSDMRVTYLQLAPHITNLAPKLFPVLRDCALRLAVNQDYLRKSENIRLGSPRALFSGLDSFDPSRPAFVNGLFGPTRPVLATEGFFSGIGNVLDQAVNKVADSFNILEPPGLKLINDALASIRIESMETSQPTEKEDLAATRLITQRAIMAEAALRAVMKLEQRDFPQPCQTESYGAEGFFDIIKSQVQVMGKDVLKYAPSVINALAPTVMGLLSQTNSISESTLAVPSPGLRRRRSFADIADQSNGSSTPLNGNINGTFFNGVTSDAAVNSYTNDPSVNNYSNGISNGYTNGTPLQVSALQRQDFLERVSPMYTPDPSEFLAPNKDGLIFTGPPLH
ncbi:uncharacterized protein N7443_008639 [Penicillium atrosanguineum]|uniref:uncharacterized protein n=1 Tax=Penicillium atrosanguineum TaxID=1132637 RepID=UPI00239A4D22|nr:uncharacterized protein N7443_008639 [Penicillium atrosanguineum]KAJ5292686.1 hypothetical protein N7443_008639 [Penicillium atrosanguineum]